MGNNINTRKFLGRKVLGVFPAIITAYDADFQLVIDAIQSTGVTLTTTEKNAGNQLVIDCKNNGAWVNSIAFYGILGGTAGAHKWNWKNPVDTNAAFRLTYATGVTHSANGMVGNGTSGYASTFLQLSENDNHFCFYSRTNIEQGTNDIGTRAGSSVSSIAPRVAINTAYFQNYNTNFISFTNNDSRGFFLNSRNSNNLYKSFINGVLKGTSNDLGVFNNYGYYLMARNNSNVAENYSTRQNCFSSLGYKLTDTQVLNFYNAVQTYQTALGRQV